MKLYSILFACVTASGLLLSGCNKDRQCTTKTELKNSGHRVSINSLQTKAPELIDSLNKYPMLQVYKVSEGNGMIRVDCHVYYKDVRMFFSTYGLLKTSNGAVNVMGNNVTDFNINISFTPAISGLDAIARAQNITFFGPDCITYALGVLDMSSINGSPGHDYKLTWQVTTEHEGAFVFIDAQTGDMLSKSEPYE